MSAALQLVMPFAPEVSYRAEDFIAGAANMNALSLIEQWPDWPYSLVMVQGEKGSGKTHLSHVFAGKSNAVFLDAARVGSMPADQLLAGSHCWVLEDIHTIRNEAALAQLINHARARGDYLLLTSARWQVTLPDLASRLKALPTVSLGSPDDGLLTAVLAKDFADRQIRVAPDTLYYAVTQLERSYAAAQDFAAKLDAASLSRGRKINLALVKECLGTD